jgi:hypothetical protein
MAIQPGPITGKQSKLPHEKKQHFPAAKLMFYFTQQNIRQETKIAIYSFK